MVTLLNSLIAEPWGCPTLYFIHLLRNCCLAVWLHTRMHLKIVSSCISKLQRSEASPFFLLLPSFSFMLRWDLCPYLWKTFFASPQPPEGKKKCCVYSVCHSLVAYKSLVCKVRWKSVHVVYIWTDWLQASCHCSPLSLSSNQPDGLMMTSHHIVLPSKL